MNVTELYSKAASSYLKESKLLGCSEQTIRNYRKRLLYFGEFLSECDLETTSLSEAVRLWRDSLLENGLAPSTVRQYMVELKAFFEYATDEERCGNKYFESNPVNSKQYPKTKASDSKPYDKVFTAEDIKKLWANRRTLKSGKLWARNYAIVTLLLDGKIRNSELLDLKLNDVHFSDKDDPFNYLIVRSGKGGKYREVDLNEISASAIKLYLKSGVRPKKLKNSDYLFGTTAEHKFGGTSSGVEEWHRGSSSWLSKLVEKHVKDVTGKSGFRTHSMRHNGAIMELNNGTSLEALQSELGHSSVTTTEIYAGRLLSKRNRMKMQDVFEERDKWAMRNNMLLEGA